MDTNENQDPLGQAEETLVGTTEPQLAEGTAAGEPFNFTHTTVREQIVDRTGELLTRAVQVAQELHRPVIGEVVEPLTGQPALVQIDGSGIKPLPASTFDSYRFAPRQRAGTAMFTRVESFIAHVLRFCDPDSVVFANEDRRAPSLTAVLDYHERVAWGTGDEKRDAQPRFGRHRAVFAFPLSDEWKAWLANDGKPLAMIEFAAFLEDHIVDVEAVEPDTVFGEALQRFIKTVPNSAIAGPTKLMALATGLKVNEASTVQEVRNLSSGEAQVQFTSEHKDADGQPLQIPGLFIITIPVFAGSTTVYRIAARLRYRKTPAGITFWYDLWRTDLVFDDAFTEACIRVAASTGLPLFYGQPEA